LVDFLPPTLSYHLAHLLLSFYSGVVGYKKPPEWRPFRWKSLYFPNPIAPAGGIDKSAKHLKAWWSLGAGFIEIGTITPQPQKQNKGTILKRSIKEQTLWNYMGFPGEGVKAVKNRLKKLQNFYPHPTPIFANIGKNRQTSNEKAENDYVQCISTLSPYVDAFVINISSPNTKELRTLSEASHLRKILKLCKSVEQEKPLFVKWSPDMESEEFLRSMDVAIECGVEGHIICNTSVKRNKTMPYPAYGGISGAPLADISKQRLLLAKKHLGVDKKNQLLISVGGVIKPEDVLERLELGADLVQVYSALVFQGPFFFRKVFQQKQ